MTKKKRSSAWKWKSWSAKKFFRPPKLGTRSPPLVGIIWTHM